MARPPTITRRELLGTCASHMQRSLVRAYSCGGKGSTLYRLWNILLHDMQLVISTFRLLQGSIVAKDVDTQASKPFKSPYAHLLYSVLW